MVDQRQKTSAVAALLLLCGVPLLAQAWAGHARMQGLVKDEQGRPVEGATVTLRMGTGRVDEKSPGPKPIKTDKNGKWSILGLADGNWGILIEKEGFIPSEGQAKASEFGIATPININLKAAPKEEAQQQTQTQVPSKNAQAKAAIEQGNTLLLAAKYAEARAEYEKANELLDPQYKPAVLRGIASTFYKESAEAKTPKEKAQKRDQAIAALKQALEIKPDDQEALQLIVNLLVEAGREPEAQTYMAKLPAGIKVDPDTMINVGIKYYNEKKLDQALAQFNKVVEQNPELPDPYYYRGLVLLNMNKAAEAKADFQKLLQLAPNHKFANDAREYLKAL